MEGAFTYMGKSVQIELNELGDRAIVTIDGKPFEVVLRTVGKPKEDYVRCWMSRGMYLMFETPEAMARHTIRYWHQQKEA